MNCKIITAISPKTDTLFLNYLFFCSLKCSYGFIPIVNFAKGYIDLYAKIYFI